MDVSLTSAYSIADTYRVGDDQHVSIRRRLCGRLRKVADDGGISVEEIITSHAWLAGNTSRDENDVRALQALRQTRWGRVVALDL